MDFDIFDSKQPKNARFKSQYQAKRAYTRTSKQKILRMQTLQDLHKNEGKYGALSNK
jgi:hypothetical protein